MRLIFTFPPAQNDEFVTGKLELILDGLSDVEVFRDSSFILHPSSFSWPASSGAPKHQRAGDYIHRRLGPIPPSNAEMREFNGYEVSTRGFENHDPGIDGLIFPISPVFVDIILPPLAGGQKGGNIQRGHFGIHRDAGLRGTLGCIGILSEWPAELSALHPSSFILHPFEFFSSVMAHLHSRGIGSLPLDVIYAAPLPVGT